jgi:hypothetical protein
MGPDPSFYSMAATIAMVIPPALFQSFFKKNPDK